MKDNKIFYLRQWLAKTIAENPDVITPADKLENPAMVYAKLQELWLKDVQVAMKSLLFEVLSSL